MRHFIPLLTLVLSATQASAFTVEVSATTDGQEKPAVIGTTNLPDGIRLIVSLSREDIDYRAQDQAFVVEGAFRAGPFTAKGKALPPGRYTLEVLMPSSGGQPQSTRQAIGQLGENLEGALVSSLSPEWKIVRFRKTVTQPSTVRLRQSQSAGQRNKDVSRPQSLDTCHADCTRQKGAAASRNAMFDFDLCYYACAARTPENRK